MHASPAVCPAPQLGPSVVLQKARCPPRPLRVSVSITCSYALVRLSRVVVVVVVA